MAKKRRNKIVYIPNQSLHEKWWAYDAEGQKQLHLEREYQKKLAKSRKKITVFCWYIDKQCVSLCC